MQRSLLVIVFCLCGTTCLVTVIMCVWCVQDCMSLFCWFGWHDWPSTANGRPVLIGHRRLIHKCCFLMFVYELMTCYNCPIYLCNTLLNAPRAIQAIFLIMNVITGTWVPYFSFSGLVFNLQPLNCVSCIVSGASCFVSVLLSVLLSV